jgi:putative transposase
MCKAFGISESGYYKYLKNRDKLKRDDILLVEIKKILAEHPENNDNYGAQRIHLALLQRGFKIGIRQVYRIMRKNNLLKKLIRHPNGITKADKEAQKSENLIQRNFSAEKPHEKLLTDISEVQCFDGKLYISPIMDCFNGEIIAIDMDDNMRKELPIATLNAVSRIGNFKGAILHSDRGSQYTSQAFRARVEELGIRQSMSGTGKCYDNARMESFFATLKKEKLYRIPTTRMTMRQVKTIIFRYVMIYYNRQRVYTRNPGGLPPAVYRQLISEEAA